MDNELELQAERKPYYLLDLKANIYSPIENFGTPSTSFETKLEYAQNKADGKSYVITDEEKKIIGTFKPNEATIGEILKAQTEKLSNDKEELAEEREDLEIEKADLERREADLQQKMLEFETERSTLQTDQAILQADQEALAKEREALTKEREAFELEKSNSKEVKKK